MKNDRNEPDQRLGRSTAVRRRSCGSHLLGEHWSCAPVDGTSASAKWGGDRVGHHLVADGSADAVQDQASGQVAVLGISKHDQAVDERTIGTGDKGSMTQLKRKSGGWHGFTLIELLVVVTILTALLLPACSQGEIQRQGNCLPGQHATIYTGMTSLLRGFQ